tara:strand:- start:368 stop:889 length:522 start_codon:yes stop_codon:yes gene_type:complete
MALTSKKYEKFYETTGSGADKIDSKKLTNVTSAWATEKAEGCRKYLDDPVIGPLVYQLQQMQDEIDYLRTEISANKDKTGITSSQANAITANTAKKGITSSQESAITANTAKTSFPGLGTTSTTALAGDTKLISLGSSTTYAFSDLIDNRGVFTIRLTATNRGVTKVLDLRLV